MGFTLAGFPPYENEWLAGTVDAHFQVVDDFLICTGEKVSKRLIGFEFEL